MAEANLAVRIATIMDASGLKKADKGISGLEASAKKLGKALGVALSVGAVTAFGKASVNAFMQDQKAAALLANTVKNLGKEMELPSIEKFISNMETATGIADDELRPAMQKLLTTFKNTADAQGILALASEVARGSNTDLATVVADLTKAAAGQTKGLEKYKLGLTQAELKAMSFADIMERLNKQFKGSNAAYLETYAGKLEVLKVAAGNVKEIIGKGLVDALMAVTGAIDVEDLSRKLIGFAQNLADAFVKVGNIIAQNWAWVKNLGVAIIAVFTAAKVYAGVAAFLSVMGKVIKAMKLMREVSIGAAIAEMAVLNPLAALAGGAALVASIVAATKLIDKLTAKTEGGVIKMPTFEGLSDPNFKKTQAQLLKESKLKSKLAADEARRKKAAALFDLTQIQIVAALKGNLSKEDRDRLELQLALATDNTTEVVRLTEKISEAQGLSKDLSAYLVGLPEANNPFAAWKGYLDEIELQALRIASFGAGGSLGRGDSFPSLSPTVQDLVSGAVTGRAGSTAAGDVYITVQGSVLSEQDLVAAVQNGLQLNSLSGKPSDIGRIAGMFG